MMKLLIHQIWTLIVKDFYVVLFRRWTTTPARAFLMPVIFMWFMSYARNLFIPPSHYGIGDVRDVRTLENALNSASGGRNRLVLVNSGGGDASNGDIASVIQSITAIANTTSAHVYNLDSDADLTNICRSSLRGVSQCIAAAVFHSSPTEGGQGKWNYTIRADGALDTKIVVADTNNDAEIYILPLQRAIDRAIAEVEGSGTQALSGTMQSFPYTSITQEERETEIRVKYMGAIIDILGVAYLIGLIGISYQLTGLVAAERESGMSQLIDCMMPNMARWQPQFARIVSHHLALDVIYLPGWVFAAIILGLNVWKDTNLGIQIIFHVLAGLALSSFAMFGASFFKRAQLSGITSVIVSLLLGVLAQVIGKSGTGIVSILGLLFPPMNYVFFVLLMSRWERRELGVNLLKAAPENPWSTPGIALWLFFVIQIIGYPLLGALIERFLYGTVSEGRKIIRSDESNVAVELDNFTKEYKPNWWFTHVAPKFGRASSSVLAVDKVNITAMKGQILVLLGANGSGKSTTLDAVCGLSKVTSGEIRINYTDGTGGLGYCPQKNVLWDDLTVEEHVRIFNALKTTGPKDSKAQISDLISACDLGHKYSAHSKTLSGGQKRKLQLAMMFTGGSNVCAVDEISSGVDPLSRRKIWDILLAERGARTIILTTHFLDEADLLSDKIAMLSRGVLKADGSAVELKHTMGSGYRVHVYNVPGAAPLPTFEGVDQKVSYDQTVYNLPSSAEAATFVAKLEEHGIKEYQVSGPTIEDVFLKVAEEVRLQDEAEKGLTSPLDGEDAAPKLVTGKRIGLPRQTWVLFTKRLVILRRNWLPYLAALFIPIIAAGLVTFFIKDSPRPGCTPSEEYNVRANSSFLSLDAFELVAGPTSKVTTQALELFVKSVNAVNGTNMAFNTNLTAVANNTVFVDTYAQFNNFVDTFFANVTPGGFYLGDASHDPTFAWQADESIWYASTMLNALDVMLSNLTIGFQYQAFDVPWAPSTGKALQMIVYFGLAMAVYPAFFTLYPTLERLRSVRALHYSNGVRSFPLWAAYLLFDFCFVVLISIVNVIIFRAVSDDWYHLEYLLAVLILYGMASALISYVISLMARSQLAAFAFAAGGQASMFLIYIIGYLVVLTYAPANKVDDYVNIVHFVIAALTPSGNLVRALFVSRNLFSILCRGDKVVSHPATLTVFGGPILYLILQSLLLFGLLLWWDNGFISFLPKRAKEDDTEDRNTSIEEVSNELARVKDSDDGLRIIHLSKQFGKNLAVDDVSFGVGKSEVFALLGPNGAGKSTTISLIRGDIQPSDRGGEILVEGVSIAKHRAAARAFLGVCPQFDAMDQMTVVEHLRFYARVRGVPDVNQNVSEVIRAVGLAPYVNRMADKLSGGNRRKLSLGIALMGNPSVLLIDEASSGMDAASKRVMWKTLASITPGRSLVLTTHSMEEADALATRAGIMARRMLALGTTDYLRKKHGNAYHVHLVHRDAPHTDDEDMARIRAWVESSFQGAVVEDKTYHGQLRFSVPITATPSPRISEITDEQQQEKGFIEHEPQVISSNKISALFASLEDAKADLGFLYYSVSQTTLDQVFLSIVGKHNVEEENSGVVVKKKKKFILF